MGNSRTWLAMWLALSATTAVASHGSNHNAWLHLRDDVDGDLRGDIMFHGGSALAYWTLARPAGEVVVGSSTYAGTARDGYRLVAVSDFDGDNTADVLWSNGSHLELWVNNGSGNYTPVSVGNFGGGWEPFAAGDVNGDGRADLFFQAGTHIAYWLMDGPRVVRSTYAGDGGAGYRVVAIDAFSGDYFDAVHSVDVLWTNGSQLKLWVGDAREGTFTPAAAGSYGNGWEPFAAGDLTGDGIAEILFRAGSHLAYWRNVSVFPLRYESIYAGDAGVGFRAISVGRYDAGSLPNDVLWDNGSQLKLWVGTCAVEDWIYGCIQNGAFIPRILGSYGGGWRPVEMLLPDK